MLDSLYRSFRNSAHICKVKSRIVTHGPLSEYTIFLHSLPNLSIPFSSVTEYTPLKYFFKGRPCGISLALGGFRHDSLSSKVVGITVRRIIFSENDLLFSQRLWT